MILVEPIERNPAALEEVARLRAEARTLDAKAQSLEVEIASLADRREQYDSVNKRQERELREQAAELRTKARRLNGDANRLERQENEPRQRVRVWDGTIEIILETNRDLSRALSEIPAYGFLTWTGVRQTFDPALNVEIYEVTSIQPARRPANFRDY